MDLSQSLFHGFISLFLSADSGLDTFEQPADEEFQSADAESEESERQEHLRHDIENSLTGEEVSDTASGDDSSADNEHESAAPLENVAVEAEEVFTALVHDNSDPDKEHEDESEDNAEGDIREHIVKVIKSETGFSAPEVDGEVVFDVILLDLSAELIIVRGLEGIAENVVICTGSVLKDPSDLRCSNRRVSHIADHHIVHILTCFFACESEHIGTQEVLAELRAVSLTLSNIGECEGAVHIVVESFTLKLSVHSGSEAHILHSFADDVA